MSYVLGSLGGFGSLGAAPSQPPMTVAAVVEVVTTGFDAVLRPIIKAQLVANPGASNDKIFNGVRFLDVNISTAKATQRAGKADYAEPYKTYRNAVEKALDTARETNRSVRTNALRFKLFGMIDAERQSLTAAGLVTPPSDKGKDNRSADRASEEDNTMLYVAGAAILALVAIGASRRKA